MQMFFQIKQTDGKWNSIDPIAWTNYEGSQSDIKNIPDGTLMKANIPNVNKDNTPYYPFKQTQTSRDIMTYDDATNSWVKLNLNNTNVISTTQGMKVVTIMSSANKPTLYVCRNNADYNLIPNISEKMRVETFISDDITKDSFTRYRQWNHYGSVGQTPFIPIAIFGIRATQTDRYMMIFGVKLETQSDGSKVLAYHESFTLPGYQSDSATDDGLLPTIQTYCYAASQSPTPTQDLNDRVTSLENRMLTLEGNVAELTQAVLSVEERVNKVLSQVSTVFVSR